MGTLLAERLVHQRLRDGLQRYPSAILAGNSLLPRAFGRRLARVSSSALLQTLPESLAGSPGLFEAPSEEAVGQTPPRWPSSSIPCACEVVSQGAEA